MSPPGRVGCPEARLEFCTPTGGKPGWGLLELGVKLPGMSVNTTLSPRFPNNLCMDQAHFWCLSSLPPILTYQKPPDSSKASGGWGSPPLLCTGHFWNVSLLVLKILCPANIPGRGFWISCWRAAGAPLNPATAFSKICISESQSGRF